MNFKCLDWVFSSQFVIHHLSWVRIFHKRELSTIRSVNKSQEINIPSKLTDHLVTIPNKTFESSIFHQEYGVYYYLLLFIYLMHCHWIRSLEMQYLLDFVHRDQDLTVLAVFETFLGCLFAFVARFWLCS